MQKFIIGLFLLIPFLGSAQSASDIINPDVKLVWLGCDFSRVRFTKSEEFTNKDQILRFFVDCNNVVKDATMEKVHKRLKRDVIKDFSFVTAKNEQVNWEEVYSDDIEYGLSDEDLQEMVKELNIDQNKYMGHIGLVFCEENYSKTKGAAKLSVVFFRVDDLEILHIKRDAFRPKGFGFMYYWSYPNRQSIWYLSKVRKELEKE
ncbi:MAG: hypothetical protein K8R86_03535 [Bacteroidales bacterium]|nr:hypothetical protein [Bacteroidales bacterium]